MLLCLDELSEVDPREAGEVAYMLANGQGKLRQSKNITLRRTLEWKPLFLSTGEISLADHVALAGRRTRGGQEVRLIDLPADTGVHGLFENLHSFRNGDELARHLQQAALRYYGAPIRAFLRQAVTERDAIAREARNFTEAFLKDNLKDKLPKEASGEAVRVCRRFALVGFAGELASDFGITGWIECEATQAAAGLFKAWLGARGTAGTDEEAMIRQVRLFIERYGNARFRRLDHDSLPNTRTIPDQAGYIEGQEDETVWYILPEVFRAEVCKGFDACQTARILQRRGWLTTSHDLRYEKRTPEGKKKLYAITGIGQE